MAAFKFDKRLNTFKASGRAQRIVVTPVRCGTPAAEIDWKIESSDSWIVPSLASYTGKQTIDILAEANDGPARSGQMRFLLKFNPVGIPGNAVWTVVSRLSISQEAGPCFDGRRNGSESDVDCGGSCGACSTGDTCRSGSDCESGVCTASICEAPPSCDDGIKNGDESDVDCGGSCSGCSAGDACNTDSDCGPGSMGSSCVDNVCKPNGGGCGPGLARIELTRSLDFPAGGGLGTFDVETDSASRVSWKIKEQVRWIRISFGKKGKGTGTVQFEVASNPEPIERTATVNLLVHGCRGRVDEWELTVRQQPASTDATCDQPATSSRTLVIPRGGGSACTEVSPTESCWWFVDHKPGWLSIDTPTPVLGSGQICVSVPPNPGSKPRRGQVVISGTPVEVVQPSLPIEILGALTSLLED